MSLLLLLGIPICSAGIYCIYKKYYSKNDDMIELKYDDLYHYQRKEKAYVITKFTFDFFPNNIDDIFLLRLNNIVDNIKVCKLEKTQYDNKLRYTTKNNDQLINSLNLNKFIPSSNSELILKTHQSDQLLSFVLDKNNKQIKVCWNHGVLDGIKFIEMMLILSNDINALKLNLPKNTFFKTMFSLGKLLCNRSILYKTGDLHKDTENGVIYSFIIKKTEIDNIRNLNNCSFMAAYQYIILKKIEGYVSKLVIATVIAISNPCQYNTSGAIPYYIDLSEENHLIAQNIDKKLKQNSYFTMITTSQLIKSVLKSKKNNINIMFSSIPISKNKLYMGDSILTSYDMYMPYHSAPVYVFSGKVDDNIYVNMGVKNKGLIEYLKQYNWKTI